MPNHKASSGLTIGASNTDDAKLARGVVIFGNGNEALRKMIGKHGLIVEGEGFEKFFHGLAIMFKGFNRVFAGGF